MFLHVYKGRKEIKVCTITCFTRNAHTLLSLVARLCASDGKLSLRCTLRYVGTCLYVRTCLYGAPCRYVAPVSTTPVWLLQWRRLRTLSLSSVSDPPTAQEYLYPKIGPEWEQWMALLFVPVTQGVALLCVLRGARKQAEGDVKLGIQIESDWPRIGQMWDFLRSVFSSFWLIKRENGSYKVPDLSHV